MRISVSVSCDPSWPFATADSLPECVTFSRWESRMLPWKSVRDSSPITRMFISPTCGPLPSETPPPRLWIDCTIVEA